PSFPENWDFRYVIVRDQNQKVIIATYFTNALWKDDTLAAANISMEVEKGREEDPYYMTSKVLSIGSLITEGKMFHLDQSHPEWQRALTEFFLGVDKIDEELNPSMITLRDFYQGDADLKRLFFEKGFIKIDMPDSCIMNKLDWKDQSGFISVLSSKSRRNFRKDVLPYLEKCSVDIVAEIPSHLQEHCYQLVKNVWRKNFDINVFMYQPAFFKQLSDHSNGEAILLYLKDDNGERRQLPSAVLYCYKSAKKSYVPVLIGMNYEDNEAFSIYRQMLYQTIERARNLGCTKINFGFSASFEKKKLGSNIVPTHAYIQAKDNYSMEMMGIIQKKK
ncbi:MAG: GNAT family N-acetyltransferase, partial [Bacteroidota bacterium]